MYPRGLFLLLCSSSFRHALLALLLGFQGHQNVVLPILNKPGPWLLRISLILFSLMGSFKKVKPRTSCMNAGEATVDTQIRHLMVIGFVQVMFHLQLISAKPGLLMLLVLSE